MENYLNSLKGRTVVVTGGSRGLGRAIVLAFCKAQARVGIVATATSDALRATLQEAHDLGFGDKPAVALGDLRDPGSAARVAAQLVSELGNIEVLVNNAGVPNVGAGSPFWKLEPDYWDRMVRTNIDGSFYLTRELTPPMIDRGFGRIVNISTGETTMVRKHLSPYGPTKAFVEAASKIFAQDLEGSGVTVNVLLPGGAVDTVADVTGQPTPGRTFVKASVMAQPILWLASDLSSGHTGRRINASLWDGTLPIHERLRQAGEQIDGPPRIM